MVDEDKRATREHSATQQLAGALRTLRIVTTLSLVFGIMAMALALLAINVAFHAPGGSSGNATGNSTKMLAGFNVTGPLIQPNLSSQGNPVITQNQTFGSRLTDINAPLNASELAVINNAQNAYFEKAGEMLLNGSINNTVQASVKNVNPITVNGKLSVVYLGSITCIFCGENRWAMALALSRFGNFTYLFKGYSSLGDQDVPTLYWSPATYSDAGFTFGSFYNSRYINFIAMENTEPISQGFSLQPFATMQQEVNATDNKAYIDAFHYILELNNFQGTPYTIWGNYQVGGADAVVFGNSTPQTNKLPLTYMTHNQVLAQLAAPRDQFSYSEYAAADLYVAMICKSMNNNASVSACQLPAIQKIEQATGY